MTKLNERIAKWPIRKRASKIIKPRKAGKYRATEQNDFKIFPKMYILKYGIPKKGIYCLHCLNYLLSELFYNQDKKSEPSVVH